MRTNAAALICDNHHPMCNANHPPVTPPRATWRFVYAHPAHWLGLGFGSGLAPKAPGTAGTLCGWALFVAAQYLLPAHWLTGTAGAALVGASIALGWWACTVSARNLNLPDPGCIVWDEIAAFWLVLWLLAPAAPLQPFSPSHWGWQVAAFALFRYFDAAKPQPVRWADTVFKGAGWRGGWGIMFDDLVAAACTLLVLAALRFGAALLG